MGRVLAVSVVGFQLLVLKDAFSEQPDSKLARLNAKLGPKKKIAYLIPFESGSNVPVFHSFCAGLLPPST